MTALNTPRPAWMTEDLVLLEEQASRFVAAEYGPHLEQWHDDHMYPREVWTKAGQAGLLCAMIPEEYGGSGGSFAHEAVYQPCLQPWRFRRLRRAPAFRIVAPYIWRFGTEEQKKRWLPKLASGELVGAIAMSEPHRLGSAERAHHRGEEGQPLSAQRLEDLITNGQHAN